MIKIEEIRYGNQKTLGNEFTFTICSIPLKKPHQCLMIMITMKRQK